MSQVDAPAADWYPDPSGRFQFRYWDGEAWTGHVSTDGKTDWDPPGEGSGEGTTGSDGGGATADPATAAEPAAEPVTEQASGSSEPSGEMAAAATSQGAAEDQWAPASEESEGSAATQDTAVEEGSAADDAPAAAATAEDADADSTSNDADPASTDDEVDAFAQGDTIEAGEPSDTNLVANQRAGLDPDVEAWLGEVASQVEPRLSRITTGWTSQPQAEAARACAYGLLIGHLAHLHPHMRSDLSMVAESHPSFTTLEAGSRLDTLEQIAQDPQRSAAWLGPLIGDEDVDRVTMLFD